MKTGTLAVDKGSHAVIADRVTFTGRELDSETGLQFNRARYVDQKTGRWTSQDPLGFDGGDSNLYRYVSNSPTNLADPRGTQPDLSMENVAGPVGGKNGAFAWGIKWKIDWHGAFRPPGGVIIQELKIHWDMKFAEGKFAGQPFISQILAKIDSHWWEAWDVGDRANGSYQMAPFPSEWAAAYKRDGIDPIPAGEANDWYAMLASDATATTGGTRKIKTNGWIWMEGVATFYECMDINDLKKQVGFGLWRAYTGAGQLLSLRGFAKNGENLQKYLATGNKGKPFDRSNPVQHDLVAYWNQVDTNGRTVFISPPLANGEPPIVGGGGPIIP